MVKAQGDVRAAELYGKQLKKSSAFIDIKRIEAAREIAKNLGRTTNRVYLDADSLLLNITAGYDENLEKRGPLAATNYAAYK